MTDAISSGSSSTEENVEIVIAQPNEQLAAESREKLRHRELYRAALFDDWETAEKYYNDPEIDIREIISEDGDTILHIAVAAERTAFVKKLVEKINKVNVAILRITNKRGNTPFFHAAICGSVELAQLMIEIEKNLDTIKGDEKLHTIKGEQNMLPLEIAALFCRKQMVEFLYNSNSVNLLNDKDRFQLLYNLIAAGLYGVALDLVEEHPTLATYRFEEEESNESKNDKTGETALHALARMPTANQKGFWKRCFNPCSNIFSKSRLAPEAVKLIECLWQLVLENSDISKFIAQPEERKLTFVAAEQGNIEFLTILIREYPYVILETDKNNYTIFHYAVKRRQEDIFELIYTIGAYKDFIVLLEDENGNNILHLAGTLAPPNRLNIVSGAALQLQRELLWFKEVYKIMKPLDAEKKNKGKKKKTPRALFTEQHKNLKKEGEKWMKDTANYCMIVATLIATVVFAAAFTVPGGIKDETGTPHFIQKASFKVFVVSDATSLVSSACSILTFLSILTSRYAEEDFLWHLPTKLVAGLATLLLSIAAMMVVFCATIFIVFKDGELWVPILVTVIAFVPVILFTYQQWRLLFDVVRSTYINSSLFQPAKHTLFFKERKAMESKKGK